MIEDTKSFWSQHVQPDIETLLSSRQLLQGSKTLKEDLGMPEGAVAKKNEYHQLQVWDVRTFGRSSKSDNTQ